VRTGNRAASSANPMTARLRLVLSHRIVLPVAILAGLFPAGGVLQAGSNVPSAAERARSDTAIGQYTGPGSCSSSSCHGSVKPRTDTPVWQNEYSIWVLKDKHARAFTALSGRVAVRMARILKLPRADTAPQCLACHALDVPPEQRAHTFDLRDGVSCESCHGPAGGWLGEHTTRNWTHEQSVARGMADLRDLGKRAGKCLTCHLGFQKQFVDHEMIAAGHPDLYFELDSFSAVMPRHWKEPLDQDPWRDVRTWATGQAVELHASLERLAGRARGDVWPEYSELECFACHHSLTPALESWRQERGYPSRRPGDPPWNASRYAVFRELAGQMNAQSATQLDAHLSHLAELMSRLNPDRQAVASEAEESAQLAEGLVRQAETQSYDRALTLLLLRKLSGDADGISGAGERAAEQAAMALDSLFIAYAQNTKPSNEPEMRAAINGLFQLLENPSAYNPYVFARQMRKVNELLR
jgi:Cytochrome c554 and c-prime